MFRRAAQRTGAAQELPENARESTHTGKVRKHHGQGQHGQKRQNALFSLAGRHEIRLILPPERHPDCTRVREPWTCHHRIDRLLHTRTMKFILHPSFVKTFTVPRFCPSFPSALAAGRGSGVAGPSRTSTAAGSSALRGAARGARRVVSCGAGAGRRSLAARP